MMYIFVHIYYISIRTWFVKMYTFEVISRNIGISISQVFPVMGVFKSKLASQQLATNKALAGWSSKWELLWLEDLLCKKRYCFFRFGKMDLFFHPFDPKKSCSNVGTFSKWWTAMLKRSLYGMMSISLLHPVLVWISCCASAGWRGNGSWKLVVKFLVNCEEEQVHTHA